MTNTTARLIRNARNLNKSAFATAMALDLVAPRAGRRWVAMCCWCLDKVDPIARRTFAARLGTGADFCGSCSYTGPDTLVVSVPR